ncbi:MAG TPA: hypothetical protein DDX40_10470 [Rikenellaceae bacterium]|nr:hypothetical protein [Rikenellaceae bacterium]
MPMRNISGHIILCLALALCSCFAAAFPQGNDYDLALDKYASICDRCVELRTGVESGQSVSMAELKSLLAELSSLRKTLSNASGKMSATQSARFEAIKNKYVQGMTKSVKKPDRPVFNPIPKIEPVTEPVEVTSQAFGFEALRQAQRPDVQAQRPEGQTQRPAVESRRLKARQRPSSENKSKPFRLAILTDAGIFPTPSYGAMAVATWNGVGAYANYRGNFRKNEYSYTCTSDGDTEYGLIWVTGKSRVSRSVATAGFAMFTSRRFGFRTGAGVTSYTRCWEDISGQWAKVKDLSFKGLAADVGIFLIFNPLVISVGVTSDFSGHADVQAGVGVRF